MASKTRARPSQVAAGDEAVSGEEREELWLPWGRMGSLNAGCWRSRSWRGRANQVSTGLVAAGDRPDLALETMGPEAMA